MGWKLHGGAPALQTDNSGFDSRLVHDCGFDSHSLVEIGKEGWFDSTEVPRVRQRRVGSAAQVRWNTEATEQPAHPGQWAAVLGRKGP